MDVGGNDDDAEQLVVPKLVQPHENQKKTNTKKTMPIWVDRPYHVWRDNFQQDRCCSKKNVKAELFTAACPLVFLNAGLIAYLIFGGYIFMKIGTNSNEHSWNKLILFCFTTISTIGYGDIYPTSFNGKLACMLYCIVGIPLLLTTISMNGLILVEIYNIINQSIYPEAKQAKDLPWFVSLTLLILHCLLGGVIFSTWIDNMPFISAVYFSFISISTIGFGDFTPTPETWFEHIVIITFLSTGIGILTTFFGTLQRVVMWIHNIGRKLTNSGDAEIWFGGNMMTVKELVVLVAEQFDCTPEKLRDVLHDLDQILEVACNQTEDDPTGSEPTEEQCCLLENGTKNLQSVPVDSHKISPAPLRKKTVIIPRASQSTDSAFGPSEDQMTVHSFTGSNQRTIPKDTEMAIQALGALQHHMRKPSTRHRSGQSRTPPALQKMFVMPPKLASESHLDNTNSKKDKYSESPLALRKKALRVPLEGLPKLEIGISKE